MLHHLRPRYRNHLEMEIYLQSPILKDLKATVSIPLLHSKLALNNPVLGNGKPLMAYQIKFHRIRLVDRILSSILFSILHRATQLHQEVPSLALSAYLFHILMYHLLQPTLSIPTLFCYHLQMLLEGLPPHQACHSMH